MYSGFKKFYVRSIVDYVAKQVSIFSLHEVKFNIKIVITNNDDSEKGNI